jgi:hypothetical protein
MSKSNTSSAGGNWATRTKTATKSVPLSKSTGDRGERRTAVVESFTPKSYKTGSFGVEVKYSVAGLQRPVYENIVLTKLSDNGTMEPTKYGESNLKRRLQAFGLDSEAINAFPIPKSPKDSGNEAYALSGAPVAIYLVDEEYLGKPTKRVRAVFPAEG